MQYVAIRIRDRFAFLDRSRLPVNHRTVGIEVDLVLVVNPIGFGFVGLGHMLVDIGGNLPVRVPRVGHRPAPVIVPGDPVAVEVERVHPVLAERLAILFVRRHPTVIIDEVVDVRLVRVAAGTTPDVVVEDPDDHGAVERPAADVGHLDVEHEVIIVLRQGPGHTPLADLDPDRGMALVIGHVVELDDAVLDRLAPTPEEEAAAFGRIEFIVAVISMAYQRHTADDGTEPETTFPDVIDSGAAGPFARGESRVRFAVVPEVRDRTPECADIMDTVLRARPRRRLLPSILDTGGFDTSCMAWTGCENEGQAQRSQESKTKPFHEVLLPRWVRIPA